MEYWHWLLPDNNSHCPLTPKQTCFNPDVDLYASHDDGFCCIAVVIASLAEEGQLPHRKWYVLPVNPGLSLSLPFPFAIAATAAVLQYSLKSFCLQPAMKYSPSPDGPNEIHVGYRPVL